MTSPFFLPLEARVFPANFLTAFLGGIAQLVERLVRNEKARGSNPLTSTTRIDGKIELPSYRVVYSTQRATDSGKRV